MACLTQTSMSDLGHGLAGLACSDHQEVGKCGETGLHRGFRGAQHCVGWWRESSLHPEKRPRRPSTEQTPAHVAEGPNRTMHPKHMMTTADFGRTWLLRETRRQGDKGAEAVCCRMHSSQQCDRSEVTLRERLGTDFFFLVWSGRGKKHGSLVLSWMTCAFEFGAIEFGPGKRAEKRKVSPENSSQPEATPAAV